MSHSFKQFLSALESEPRAIYYISLSPSYMIWCGVINTGLTSSLLPVRNLYPDNWALVSHLGFILFPHNLHRNPPAQTLANTIVLFGAVAY